MKIGEDLLTMADIAPLAGMEISSLRTAYARAKVNRANGVEKPTDMPSCDYMVGRTPVWKPDTVLAWLKAKGK